MTNASHMGPAPARTKRHFDEFCEDESLSNEEEQFKVSVFYAALDTAIA